MGIQQTPKVVQGRVSAGGESFKSVIRSSAEGETVFESVIESLEDEPDLITGKETSVAELALASIPGTPKKLMVADWLDEHAAEGELKLPPPPPLPISEPEDLEWIEQEVTDLEPPEGPPPPPPEFDEQETEEPVDEEEKVVSAGSELTSERRTRPKENEKSPSFLERMFGSGKKSKSVSKETLDSPKDDGVEGDTESLEAEETLGQDKGKLNELFGLRRKKRGVKNHKEKIDKKKLEVKTDDKPTEIEHELEEPKATESRRRSSSKKLFGGLFGKKDKKPSNAMKDTQELKAEEQTGAKAKPEIIVKDSFTVGDEGPNFGYLEVESDGSTGDIVLEEKKVQKGTDDGQQVVADDKVKRFRLFPVKKSKSSDNVKQKVEKNEKKGLGWSDSELWRPKNKKIKKNEKLSKDNAEYVKEIELEQCKEIAKTENPEGEKKVSFTQENENKQFKRTFSFPMAWKKKKKKPSKENQIPLSDKENNVSDESDTEVEPQPGYIDIFFSKKSNKKVKQTKKNKEARENQDKVSNSPQEKPATGSYNLQQVTEESSGSEDYYKKKEHRERKKENTDDSTGAFIRNILGMEAGDPKLISARPLPTDKEETPDIVQDNTNYQKDKKIKNNKRKKQPEEVLRLIQVFGSQDLSDAESLKYSTGDISFSSQDELETSKNSKKRRKRKPFFGGKSKTGKKRISKSDQVPEEKSTDAMLGHEEEIQEDDVEEKVVDDTCSQKIKPDEFVQPKTSEKISLRRMFAPRRQPKPQKPPTNQLQENKSGKDFKSMFGLKSKDGKGIGEENVEQEEEPPTENIRKKEKKVKQLKKKGSESSSSGDEQKLPAEKQKNNKKLLELLGLKVGVEAGKREVQEESEKIEGEQEEVNLEVTPKKKKPKLTLFGSKESKLENSVKEKDTTDSQTANVLPEDKRNETEGFEKEGKKQTENPKNSIKNLFGSKTKIETTEKKSKRLSFERSKSLESTSSGESTGKGVSGSYNVQKNQPKKSFWGFKNDKHVKSDSGLDLERRSSTESITSSEDSSGRGGGLAIAAPIGKWGPKRKNSPLAERRTMSGEYCFTGDAPEKAALDAVVLKSFKFFDENGTTLVRGKSEDPPRKRPSSYHEGQAKKTLSLRPLSFGAHITFA